MNTVLTVLRQDLLNIRWVLAAWIALTAALTLRPFDPANAAFTTLIDYALVFGLMSSLVLWGVLFTRISLGHSPIDSRNGWRTRPLAPGLVLLAKVLLLCCIFIAPFWIAGLVHHNNPPLLAFSYILLAALFVSSLVPTQRALVAALLIVATSVFAALTLFNNRPLALVSLGLSSTGETAAQWIYVVGIGGLLLRQYLRPHTALHAAGAGGVVILIIGLGLVFPNRQVPLPWLHRPDVNFTLSEATPLNDADWIGSDFYRRDDQRYAAHSGTLRSHRNWRVRLRVEGIAPNEIWYVRQINALNRHHPGLSHRTMHRGAFLTAGNLAPQLMLGRETTFIGASGTEFEYEFQWVRWDGSENFPEAPTNADFQFQILRINHFTVFARVPLAVGKYGPPRSNGARSLNIETIDWEARTFTGSTIGPNVPPADAHQRYSALTLIAFNPKAHEAGFVQPLPTNSPDTLAQFRLPRLSGDPKDWQLLLFMAEADAQVILAGR